MTTARAKPGDVLEVKTGAGFSYLHYVGKHSDYGDIVVVSPQNHECRPAEFSDTFDPGYVAFYPVRAAVSRGLVEIVGRTPIPSDLPPKRLRRAGARSDQGVETWIIETESGEVVKKTLSPEEQRLPIGAIWNHAFLLHRLAERWSPEMET